METLTDIPPPTEGCLIPPETAKASNHELMLWISQHFSHAFNAPQSRNEDLEDHEWNLSTKSGLNAHFHPGTIPPHIATAAFLVFIKGINIPKISAGILELSQMNDFIRPRTAEQIQENFEQWIYIENDDGIVGCCEVIEHGEVTELGAFMVHPDYQGNGIGAAIFEQFNAKKQKSAFAVVHKDNPAYGFFEKYCGEPWPCFPPSIRESGRDLSDRFCFMWD